MDETTWIDRRIGRYEVVSELGRGGMGIVFRARDTELPRFVALKSLPVDRDVSPERRKRFLTEVRAAAVLSHPHLVPVYDLVSEAGQEWMVMELVEGESLDEAIPPAGLPIPRALRWAVEIADGVAAAHRAGIVHRDLKPSNVIIDRDGRARVLDFGLAKIQAAPPGPDEATRSAPLTRAGVVLGTFDYMSPEQALARPVDARADVFSLGVVLYEMLTGQRPFRGDSVASTIHAVAYEREDPPESFRPELSAELVALLRRALAKAPAERFQSMAELRDALAALARGETVPASVAAGDAPKATGGAGRRRLLALLGAVALAGLLALAWLALRPRSSGDVPAAALPATPFQLHQEAAELLSRYWRSGYVERAIDGLRRAIADQPRYAPAYAALAEAYLRRFEGERDRIWLERSRAHAQQALELDPSLDAARLALGLARRSAGDLDGAEAALGEVARRDPGNARARRGLADVAAARDRKPEAEGLYREAVALAPADPELHSALGTYLFDAGRYQEAAAAFDAATAIEADFVFGHRNAAAAFHMLGDYGRAAERLQRALVIRPDAPSYSNLGTLYFFQGLYPQALEAYERAIELGANDYLVWANLGDAYRFSPGRQREARRAYTRALQLLEQESGAVTEEATVESRRALLLAKRGARVEASALAERWAARAVDPASLYRLALAFELAGERPRALDTLAAAVASGYSEAEIRQDPELTALREDPEYHRRMADAGAPARGH